MRKYKALSYLFTALALLLSHIMCAVVAWSCCDMLWGIRCAGYSAPASAALVHILPYGAAAALCGAAAWFFRKRQ